MTELSRRQLSIADGLIREEVAPLWDNWLRQVDAVLDDSELVQIVYEVLAERCPESRSRSRPGTPVEVLLRLLVLKRMNNWSYHVLERKVRANLVYREFTRAGAEKLPDAKTLGRLALALGPTVVAKIHQRIVAIAQERQLIAGRQLRVDTTVVETNIHYPTDSALLGDGVRVLMRTMQKITEIVGKVGTKLRDRTRAVRNKLIEIGRASRSRQPQGQERMKTSYKALLCHTSRAVSQAKRFANEVGLGVKCSDDKFLQSKLDAAKKNRYRMIPLVQQVMHQTRERGFKGETHVPEKLVSVFGACQ